MWAYFNPYGGDRRDTTHGGCSGWLRSVADHGVALVAHAPLQFIRLAKC